MVKKQRQEFEKHENGRYCRVRTTVGRLKFNYNIPIPREMGFYNCEVDKKTLGILLTVATVLWEFPRRQNCSTASKPWGILLLPRPALPSVSRTSKFLLRKGDYVPGR